MKNEIRIQIEKVKNVLNENIGNKSMKIYVVISPYGVPVKAFTTKDKAWDFKNNPNFRYDERVRIEEIELVLE